MNRLSKIRSSFAFVSAMTVGACAATPTPPVATPAPSGPAPAASTTSSATPDESFRKSPPAAGTDGPFVAPHVQEKTLSNGVRLLVVERHDLPVVAFDLAFDRGADQDKPGVAAFLGGMLLRGTKTRSALDLSDRLEALGATASAWADYDGSWLSARSLAPNFGDTLDLMADVARNPALARDEIERERSQRLTSIAQQNDRPATILWNVMDEVLYPANHPYASPLLGSEDEVKKMGAVDLARFHDEAFRPDRLTVSVAGDVRFDDVVARVEKAFGGWKGKAAKARAVAAPPAPTPDDPRVILVDRPDAPQSNVALAMVGLPRLNKDFDALVVMNTILGGAFTSRLNLNLREAHAYTYGAGSSFDFRHGPGPFRAGGAIVREKTGPAVKEILKEVVRIRTEPVTDAELADARAQLVRSLPARFETVGATAGAVADLAVDGLPFDEYATRPARFAKVTAEDVKRVASTYLVPGAFKLVVVGDAKVIQGDLRDVGLGAVTLRKSASNRETSAAKSDKKPTTK